MGSLGEIVEFVRHSLAGFDASKESVVALTSGVNAASLFLPIDDATPGSGASRGIAEIDLEIVRVKRVDPDSQSLELYPFGRGYRGTKAVPHQAGAEVRLNPAWPSSTVAREVNGVLAEIYPLVYSVRSHITSVQSDQGPLDLPPTAMGVIAVFVEDSLNQDQWIREDRWSLSQDSTDLGRPLRVGGPLSIGDRVRVVYAARPELFDLTGSWSQDFADTTGLDPRLEDLLRLGVAVRMAPFIDVARLPFVAAEAEVDSPGRPPGGAASASRLLYSMFQARLAQEAAVLAREHPIRVHYTGGK